MTEDWDDGHDVPTPLGDPEAAWFIRGLHEAQGMGMMFYRPFRGVKTRIQKLVEAIQDDENWTTNAEKDLGRIDGHLRGAKTPEEVKLIAEELMSLANEWRSGIRVRFYKYGVAG
jgi:hypothetical protein